MSEEKNFPECFLGSIISPGKYWLVSKLKSHVEEVKNLENELSVEMNGVSTLSHVESLAIHKCVAVRNRSKSGLWQRGTMLDILENELCKVFLIDCGHEIETSVHNIQIIKDPKYTEVEPLSFKMHLYGLVPCVHLGNSSMKQVSKDWSDSAINFINNFFLKKIRIYAKEKLTVNRTVLGDIYFLDKPNGKLFSLGRILCMEGFAVYSEAYFKANVMGKDSLESQNGDFDGFGKAPSKDLNNSQKETGICHLSPIKSEDRSQDSEESRSKTGTEKLENDSREASESPLSDPTPCSTSNNSTESESSDKEPRKVEETDRKSLSESPKIRETSSPFIKKVENVKFTDDESCNKFRCGKDYPNFEIFTRFDNCAVEPLNTFKSLNISQHIVLNLNRQGNFTDLSPIQRWAIPSIQRGHNLVIIGSPKTGKTLSYIIPLLEMLHHKFITKDFTVGNGPLAIILCSESTTCEYISRVCSALIYNRSDNEFYTWRLTIEMVCGSINHNKNTWVKLTNGCDVLITTPLFLERLLNYKGVTNLERLSFLILDESDIISQEPHLTQVKILLHKAKKSEDIQTIFCGEKWIPEMRNLLKTFVKNPAFIIGSYLEAAVYAEVKPNVFFVDSEKKLEVFRDLILGKIGCYNIMIACEKASEVMELQKIFKLSGQTPLVAHSGMTFREKKVVRDAWKYSQGKNLIVCTDDAIHDLCISNVELLVHYSLPVESKTNFGNRFSTIINNLDMDKVKNPSVVILVDDQNHFQLPHIVDFVIRLGGKIPENIIKVCNDIKRLIETNKKDQEICVNLLRFGDCKKFWRCPKRHAFINEIDSSERSLCGILRFQVLAVHSPSHLSIRAVELTQENNKKTGFDDLSVEISDRLNEYYGDEENRRVLGEIKMNCLCAAKVNGCQWAEHDYHRARVIEFKKYNKFKKPTEVVIKLIDCGPVLQTSIYNLFDLAEELRADPPQCLDCFLCNLLPNDFDAEYSYEALLFSKKLFLEDPEENQYWMGVVKLSLDSILFLEPVKLCHTLQNLNTKAIDVDARRKLLSSQIAVENDRHMEKMYSLCEEAGIKIVKFDYKKEEGVSVVQPQRAFLPTEPAKVRFLAGDEPSSLFFRIRKFEDLLRMLEKECGTEVCKLENDSEASKPEWKVGMYCLALNEGSWSRARIEDKKVNEVSVYFIDHGLFKITDNIFPITEKLLLQLPAQAIECYLAGTEKEKEEETMDVVKKFLDSGKDEISVLAMEKDSKSEITGGRKYGINLLCKDGKSLIKMLIDSGLIAIGENSSRLAEDNGIVPSDAEEANDEEEELSRAGNDSDREKDSSRELWDDGFDEDNGGGDGADGADGADRADGADGDDGYESNFLKPDAFDDESAQFMLQEFMSRFLPEAMDEAACGAAEEDSKSEEGTGRKALTEVPETKGGGKPEENVLRLKKTSRQFLKQYLSKNCNKKLDILPVQTYTPDVLWSQSHTSIQLKIMLNNVKTFKLDSSPENFVLRCLLDNKLYLTNLRLFGSVDPPMTRVNVKTFFLSICLRKLCPMMWPRLSRSQQKFRWIKYDVEEYVEAKRTIIEDLCKEAAKRVEAGNIVVPEIVGEVKFVPSTDSEGTSASDSESFDEDYVI